MIQSYSLQASIKGKLNTDFRKYVAQENVSDAEAARQLLTLALRIVLDDTEDSRPSNRDLLEEMYRRIRYVGATSNLIHTQGFDGAAFYENKKEATEMRKVLKSDVDNKVDAYLSGENKAD